MTGVAVLAAAAGLCGPVVISEVMYYPASGTVNSEFVELVNLADTSVDLSGWFVADLSTDHPDTIQGEQLQLQPGGYAVIFEGDYDTTTGIYRDLIPASALLLFVDDNEITGSLNNDGDTLFLIDARGNTVDIMGWGPEVPTRGHSLEKIILDDCPPAGGPGNWRPSLELHGSPGDTNTVAGRKVDLALDALDYQEGSPGIYTITATITNAGLVAAGGQLFADGMPMVDVAPLAAGETRLESFPWTAPAGLMGMFTLTVDIAATGDYDSGNNWLSIDLPLPAAAMATAINEIMYTPLAGEPEWVELVNTTASMVNLQGWQLRDQDTGAFLPDTVLSPDEYAVVAGDSTGTGMWAAGALLLIVTDFPTLNNTGDQVILIDAAGLVIDQVDYSLFPLTSTGRSLEKVSPTAHSQEASSWVTSPATQGHTAGELNSVQLPRDQTGVTLEPNPLPLNTAASILMIQYVTPFATANLRVEIYDLAGRRVGTITRQGPVQGAGVISWDARSVDPVRYKTGQYVLLFRAVDAGSTRRWERMKRLILVN